MQEDLTHLNSTEEHVASAPDSELAVILYPLLYVTFSGMVMSVVFMFLNYIYQEIKKRLVCSVKIISTEPSYKIVLDFLIKKGFLKNSMS